MPHFSGGLQTTQAFRTSKTPPHAPALSLPSPRLRRMSYRRLQLRCWAQLTQSGGSEIPQPNSHGCLGKRSRIRWGLNQGKQGGL